MVAYFQVVNAAINVRDGGFIQAFKDFSSPNEALGFSRTFNSRSVYEGYFGLNWCSDLELKLVIKIPNKILLNHCGEDKGLKYIDGVSKRGQNELSSINIYKQKNYYIWLSPKGAEYIFNRQGLLVKIKYKNNLNLVLIYKNNRLYALKPIKNKTYYINWGHGHRKIIKIYNDNSFAEYKYNQETLQSVSNSKVKYKYNYDQHGNMTAIHSGQKLILSVSYDLDQDRVVQIKYAYGCTETLSYKFLNTNSKSH